MYTDRAWLVLRTMIIIRFLFGFQGCLLSILPNKCTASPGLKRPRRVRPPSQVKYRFSSRQCIEDPSSDFDVNVWRLNRPGSPRLWAPSPIMILNYQLSLSSFWSWVTRRLIATRQASIAIPHTKGRASTYPREDSNTGNARLRADPTN